MVMILEFRQPDSDMEASHPARPQVRHPKGRSAEIIIFPGVRIEREGDHDPDSTVAKTRKRAARTARRKS